MSGANIVAGDVVIVERQATAAPGEIVVAVVDGELTVKRLEMDGDGWLLPASWFLVYFRRNDQVHPNSLATAFIGKNILVLPLC
jgi:hypothetical protein